MVDPGVYADVILVDTVLDTVTADISPVEQVVAQQAAMDLGVTP